MKNLKDYFLINKCVFFPKEGILVVGDLHLGYESSIVDSGILLPEEQIKKTLDDLKEIFERLEKAKLELKKIVFLGDIKHLFGFDKKELFKIYEILDFAEEKVGEENLILIKGNHDTQDYSRNKRMKAFHVEGDILFLHGHKEYKKINEKGIKKIVMAHLHPSIILNDEHTYRSERYKSYLVGKWKRKEVIILPSFLPNVAGQPVNNYNFGYEDYFSIIPKKNLMKFEVYVVSEDKDKEILDFGSVKSLVKK